MQVASITQAYRDSRSNTNEEYIRSNADGHEALIKAKPVVESVCDSTSQPKREDHTGSANTKGCSPIPNQEAQIHLKSYQEEEKNQTHVGRG